MKTGKFERYIVLFVLTIFIMFFFSIFILYKNNYLFNFSESQPKGLYKSNPFKTSPTHFKGKLITLCPPNNSVVSIFKKNGWWLEGAYCKGHAPFIKKLVGIPGDRIRVNREGVYINDEIIPNSAPNYEKLNNIEFELPYKTVLKKNEYWVMSDFVATSFDSRYFGPVKRNNLIGSIDYVFSY